MAAQTEGQMHWKTVGRMQAMNYRRDGEEEEEEGKVSES